ncbi:ACT domain-containing protein [Stenomitos frigidus]|uniref:ACT domain-containing protein n=1 Tax=Stenomitos frigidus ULC18 TaxID=2107698 RepID=A0A2T1E6F8_9CYAN|nr:ACT domain-containing protein [Stenomitos frigidus]PSB28326.1 ACT domain-containing protein [Stenomitos frigidus ULC18]
MPTAGLTLSVLPDVFAVCRLKQNEPIPAWSLQGFFSITRTEDERSIVCSQANMSLGVQAIGLERDWRCFKVEGSLDFALTGILLSIAAPLAEAGIGIFAISTYETDYILVKQSNLDRAVQALSKAGHQLVQPPID